MCCLYGLIDYRHSLSVKQKNRVLSALATAAEARGTDATGIAYNAAGMLRVYKRPWPGHCMHFHVPREAAVVMGHTRMTTQGSERRNYNNHPFYGTTGTETFALAHNGVLYNDHCLRRSLSLPKTKIETDSYIGVQLIERKGALDFDSLRYMAEQVEGSFTFTVLDRLDNLYIVKGDTPLYLLHFPSRGLYLYASTEEILKKALSKIHLPTKGTERVKLDCGEILRIDTDGQITRSRFDDSNLCFSRWGAMWPYPYSGVRNTRTSTPGTSDSYLEEIKSVATAFGYTPKAIDQLADMGFSPEELEEFLYCGEI